MADSFVEVSKEPIKRTNIKVPSPFGKPVKSNFNPKQFKQRLGNIQRLPPPAKIISREEAIMQQLFNGQPTFGTGTCLPKLNGILRRGRGLINSGDAGETGSMFGI